MKRPWQKHLPAHKTTPSEFAFAAAIDVFVLCGLGVLLWLCLGFASGAKGAELVPGSVLVSRNLNEADNAEIPGTMNHLAIVAKDGDIVESMAPVGVQKITMATYLSRPYETPLVLLPKDRQLGERAAEKAATLVGTKFRKASSIFNRFGPRRVERGLNCVALVELCYADAGKRLRRVTKPDDIFKLKEVFEPARRLVKPADSSPAASKGRELHGAQESFVVRSAAPVKSGWYFYRPAGCIDGKGIYEEVLSRCGRRSYFESKYARDKATCVHEACHGVNNRIWNRMGAQAFYTGEGKYCILREPDLVLPTIGRYVQPEYRTGYYDLYFGQAARSGGNYDRPLYVLDEFSAYVVDLQAVKELGVKDTGSSAGTKHFVHFADCLVRAVQENDRDYPDLEPLTQFVAWQKARVAELSQ